MLSWAMNLSWLEQAQCAGFDECLLLDEMEAVSECTSANIFAAFGNEVVTPPLSSGCLPGITRELLLGPVRAPEYPVVERTLYPSDLQAADEVFITSTTRELLPVFQIDGAATGSNDAARSALQSAFSSYVDDYVAERKPAAIRP
jgi:branched-subunit amino acid aminotransferase/4-amino-4-deoxychorismate lyase